MIPAVLGFGVWGLTVGQVGLSLSVVVAMTIGIVVDDTVHFLSKYRRARREYGQGPEEAVRYAFDTAGRALFATTVVLVAGFLIFAFSPFVPTAQVGVLTAMIIAFALVADLTLLPALLTAVDRSSKGRTPPRVLNGRLPDSASVIGQGRNRRRNRRLKRLRLSLSDLDAGGCARSCSTIRLTRFTRRLPRQRKSASNSTAC